MGKMMLHTIARTSFPPDELTTIAEAVGELRAVPLPGVLSVKEEVLKPTRPPSLWIKSSGKTRHSRDSHLCFFCPWCFPASLIHLSLLQKVVRISIRLTEASQPLAVLMRMVHPMEQRDGAWPLIGWGGNQGWTSVLGQSWNLITVGRQVSQPLWALGSHLSNGENHPHIFQMMEYGQSQIKGQGSSARQHPGSNL